MDREWKRRVKGLPEYAVLRTKLTISNKSRTLPFENRKNVACIALSPDGQVLISIDAGEYPSTSA
jgi:hypothetical protein